MEHKIEKRKSIQGKNKNLKRKTLMTQQKLSLMKMKSDCSIQSKRLSRKELFTLKISQL